MARGATPPPPSALPKVVFTKVNDDFTAQPAGVADLQARSYGYNDGSSFRRPDHYIRYIEPLESELAVQVEYDMDEQDREWLESVNADRRKDHVDKVSYEVFEIVMDRLEKEWFDLTKNIPKPDLAMPSEDSTCAICDDSEGENTNAIVFCDGCNLAVHQDCYGVPYIPEGQWLCRKCTVSPENPVSCILCPNEGGAFKQTVHGEWVHLLCAIWVPETRVDNDVFMEPVVGVEKISKQRWKLRCSICDIREGACIQCIKTSCFLAFHATCARKEKLLMPMKATQGSEAPTLACYCEKHLPREQVESRTAAFASEKAGGETDTQKSSKTARAYSKAYTLGPPLVPKIIVDRIMQYIGKVTIRQKREFVVMVCKYWSLKREARRGAPLLKRLHLEPWTASAGGRNQSEGEKIVKLELLKRLKGDLERVREMANLAKKREVQKLLQARALRDLIYRTLLQFQPLLRSAFERITSYDRLGFFKNPVSKLEVPDYYDVIKRPICWSIIDKKLDNYEYVQLQDFKNDVALVLDNAMLYNRPDTQYYRVAQKIRVSAEKIFVELDQIKVPHPEVPPLSSVTDELGANTSLNALGDLEPPLETLRLLLSHSAITDNIDSELTTDPLSALFNYELPKPKPPAEGLTVDTDPASASVQVQATKVKRDRKADLERARLARLALDASAGFRGRTRSSAATAEPETSEFAGSTSWMLQQDAMIIDGDNEHALDADDAQRKSNGKKPKRTPIILPGQSEVPPVVEEVDDRKMFRMFDAGWIFAEGQKRGGRGTAPTTALPVDGKKKKGKGADRERSHLSTEGTAVALEELAVAGPSDSHAIEGEFISESVQSTPIEATLPPGVVMNIDLQPPPAHASLHDHSSESAQGAQVPLDDAREEEDENIPAIEDGLASQAEQEPEQPPRNATEAPENEVPDVPVKTIIIEELDTPATRRIKNRRKKAERLQRAAASAFEPSSITGPSTSELRDADGDVDMNLDVDAHSDLTALSSEEDEADDGGEGQTGEGKGGVQIQEQDRGKVVLERGKLLEEGTLVWAKTTTYPWWPAVVVDADSPDAPPDLLESVDAQSARKEKAHLVRFFDGKNEGNDDSWNWVALKDLRMFGEDKDLDEDMINKRSKRQRWKDERLRHLCRKAFKRAIAEMDVPVDDR